MSTVFVSFLSGPLVLCPQAALPNATSTGVAAAGAAAAVVAGTATTATRLIAKGPATTVPTAYFASGTPGTPVAAGGAGAPAGSGSAGGTSGGGETGAGGKKPGGLLRGLLNRASSAGTALRAAAAGWVEDMTVEDVELQYSRDVSDKMMGKGTISPEQASNLTDWLLSVDKHLEGSGQNKPPIFPDGRRDVCVIDRLNEDGIVWVVATDVDGKCYIASLANERKTIAGIRIEDRGDRVIVMVICSPAYGERSWIGRFRIRPPQGAAASANLAPKPAGDAPTTTPA